MVEEERSMSDKLLQKKINIEQIYRKLSLAFFATKMLAESH